MMSSRIFIFFYDLFVCVYLKYILNHGNKFLFAFDLISNAN